MLSYYLTQADCGKQLLHRGVEVASEALVAESHEAILVAIPWQSFIVSLCVECNTESRKKKVWTKLWDHNITMEAPKTQCSLWVFTTPC